jgi:hypothetical protein
MEQKLHLLLGIYKIKWHTCKYWQYYGQKWVLFVCTLFGIIYYLKLEVSQMNDILLNYKNIVWEIINMLIQNITAWNVVVF